MYCLALPLWQNMWSYLEFDAEDRVWRVFVDRKATDIAFGWDQVRGSIAYRALCFEDEQEMNEWNEYDIDSELTIDGVMDILKGDLVERNRISASRWESMDRFELGKFVMTEYVKLPAAELSYVPFNYCAVLDVLPQWITNSAIGQLVERIWC